MSVKMFESVAKAIEFPDWAMYGIADAFYRVFGPAADLTDKLLKGAVPQLYTFTANSQHALSKKLPLMSPGHVLFAMIAYFAIMFVLYAVGRLGIAPALKLKALGLVHNLFLYTLSLYMCLGVFITARGCGYSLWNNGVGEASDPNSWRMAKLIWVFYVSKIPEFGDTFIMILKHNYRQVSFLHIYHHTTIFGIWFIVTNMGPGGEAYFSASLNSGVHVVMYGYYFVTSAFSEGAIRNFVTRFKFFITYGQMTQFCLNMIQSVYDLYLVKVSNYNPALTNLLLYYMMTLLALFYNFLRKNKGKPQAAGKKSAPAAAPAAKSPSTPRGSKSPSSGKRSGSKGRKKVN